MEFDVLNPLMPRQHHAGLPCLHKINTVEFIPLKVYIFTRRLNKRNQKRTYPIDKVRALFLDEVYFSEGGFVDEECHLQLQILRQLINEVNQIIRILTKLIFQRFFHPLIQLHWQEMLFVNSV